MSKAHSAGLEPAPHVALFPGSGMGHLTPFLRLATSLVSRGVSVTFITAQPTVLNAESQALSQFFSACPQIYPMTLTLSSDDSPANSDDPIHLQFDLIRRSSQVLLPPLLSSMSKPLSAFITDMTLATSVIPITKSLGLPNYILFTSSAKMLTLFASFHTLSIPNAAGEINEMGDTISIPGLQPVPRSWVPPPLLLESDNLFKTMTVENGRSMLESNGILVNTFESFEQESLAVLNSSKVVDGLPVVIPLGPFAPFNFKGVQVMPWLDHQPAGSVMYVSFGSRTATSREQINEIGEGLVRSGCAFLWVVKDKIVDCDDEAELSEIVGHKIMEKAKEKGLVVKSWVSQEEVLGHPAVGGFLSHCGWNSVIEAAWYGVPILAWPHHGDQKINAHVVESSGLGLWAQSWGWGGGEVVVKREEISERIRKVMGNKLLREKALKVREEARAAAGYNGSSNKGLIELLKMWTEK